MAPLASLTRTVEFRATHRLALPGLSDAANRERFGWTAAPPGHLHRYRCSVTVAGPTDLRAPMVMDLGELDGLLRSEVLEPLADRMLNQVAPFDTVLPTCEAIAIEVYRRVSNRLPNGVRLERVRVAEDETLEAEYGGG